MRKLWEVQVVKDGYGKIADRITHRHGPFYTKAEAYAEAAELDAMIYADATGFDAGEFTGGQSCNVWITSVDMVTLRHIGARDYFHGNARSIV